MNSTLLVLFSANQMCNTKHKVREHNHNYRWHGCRTSYHTYWKVARTCKDLGQAFSKSIDRYAENYVGTSVFEEWTKICIIRRRFDCRWFYAKTVIVKQKNKRRIDFFLGWGGDHVVQKTCHHCCPQKVLCRILRKCHQRVLVHTKKLTPYWWFTLWKLYKQLKKTWSTFTQDTDWWVLILRRLPELGPHSAIVTGTGINRRTVVLQPIYDKLGPEICSALPGFHSITGADGTGRIHGVGKKTAFKVLLKCPLSVLTALTQIGSDSIPPPEVISGCEQALKLSHLCLQQHWDGKKNQKLTSSQNVQMLPPTAGTWLQYINKAYIWAHNKDSYTWSLWARLGQTGWSSPADFVKCKYGSSFCSRRCTCMQNNLPCTNVCKCEANELCMNTHPR